VQTWVPQGREPASLWRPDGERGISAPFLVDGSSVGSTLGGADGGGNGFSAGSGTTGPVTAPVTTTRRAVRRRLASTAKRSI